MTSALVVGILIAAALIGAALITALATGSGAAILTGKNGDAIAQQETNGDLGEVLGMHLIDTETISLSGVLQKDDFKLLMDTTPYVSEHAHIALKVPCGPDGEQKLTVVAGTAPDVSPVSLDYVSALSNPPHSCLYHGDIGDGVTDIAILNTSHHKVIFGDSAGYSATITFHGETSEGHHGE